MRKELVWVIVIGIIFGLIFAFGAWRINSSIEKSKITNATPTPSSGLPGSEFKITLNTPGENDVVTTSPVNVSGITKALAWVTVSGEDGDYILQSDEKGLFSQDVVLAPGINQIKITAFDPKGSQSVQKVIVIYSSAFQLRGTSPTPEGQTESSDASSEVSIRDKVAQKVAEAMNKPKAYFGTVTDIVDSTIQIKTPDAQIEQIAVGAADLTVINAKGTANKQVKLTDIAIGDFITAMGYVGQKSVLGAQRILITSPLTEAPVNAYFGNIEDIVKSSLTLRSIKDSSESVISLGSKTVVKTFFENKVKMAKTGTLAKGQGIVLVGVTNTNALSARSIFIVQDN